MKFYYRAFSSNQVTEGFLELLNLVYLSGLIPRVTYDFDIGLFHNPLILKISQI